MLWLGVILGVLVLGVVAALAAGRFGHLPDVEDRLDQPGPAQAVLAGGPVTAGSLRAVRFPLTFRGYRMDEVDALLDRLADQLEHGGGPSEQPRAD